MQQCVFMNLVIQMSIIHKQFVADCFGELALTIFSSFVVVVVVVSLHCPM